MSPITSSFPYGPLELVVAFVLLFTGGCASPARTATPSTLPTTVLSTAESNPAYVTLALDDTATEWEFVHWLRAGGVHVAKDANGDDRIFDTPACRAILVRYRRMLRVRLDLIGQNIANVNTTRDANGASNPYRRRFVVANADGTFQIREDPSPFLKRYIPGHPDADADGYVQFPNVDLAIENVNADQTFKSYRVITRILMHFDASFVDINGDEDSQSFRSTTAQDALYKHAVERTLAAIIGKFPGVADAVVVIDSNGGPKADNSFIPSATISITTNRAADQPVAVVDPAADMVVGAVPGIRREKINVVVDGVSYRPANSANR